MFHRHADPVHYVVYFVMGCLYWAHVPLMALCYFILAVYELSKTGCCEYGLYLVGVGLENVSRWIRKLARWLKSFGPYPSCSPSDLECALSVK